MTKDNNKSNPHKISIDDPLWIELQDYLKLTKYKNATPYILDLIKQDMKGKQLTNNNIDLEQAYYFSWSKFLKENEVQATTTEPEQNLNDMIIIKSISNNLDTISKEHNTYCFNNNPALHKGLYIHSKEYDRNEFPIYYYILFTYNTDTKELNLKLLYIDDVGANLYDYEINQNIIIDKQNLNYNFYKDIPHFISKELINKLKSKEYCSQELNYFYETYQDKLVNQNDVSYYELLQLRTPSNFFISYTAFLQYLNKYNNNIENGHEQYNACFDDFKYYHELLIK